MWLRTYLRFASQPRYLLPPEPVEPLADPEAKKEDEIIKMAKAIMAEVVDQLLNEAAEVVLKEE